MLSINRLVVVGATGLVGEAFLNLLTESSLNIQEIVPIASERSVGKYIGFSDKKLVIRGLAGFVFKATDVVFVSAGTAVAKQVYKQAAKVGCVVIDNSSAFRYDSEVPLVIPEVNGHILSKFGDCKLISNPNCSVIPLVMAIKPIYDAVGIERINVCTYQSVSGAGRNALNQFNQQLYQDSKGVAISVTDAPIYAGNIVPSIDILLDNQYTKEEMKLYWETQKILEDHNVKVNATAVRVPVAYGHSAAVHLETKSPIEVSQITDKLKNTPGVCLLEDEYPMPRLHAAGSTQVFVGRVRKDVFLDNGLNLWVVSDNILRGSAYNALQILRGLSASFCEQRKVTGEVLSVS